MTVFSTIVANIFTVTLTQLSRYYIFTSIQSERLLVLSIRDIYIDQFFTTFVAFSRHNAQSCLHFTLNETNAFIYYSPIWPIKKINIISDTNAKQILYRLINLNRDYYLYIFFLLLFYRSVYNLDDCRKKKTTKKTSQIKNQ